MECNGRFIKTKILERAPAWFVAEVALATGREDLEGVGLPNDHRSFSLAQRKLNAKEQARLDAETTVQRIRRVARERRGR